MLDIKDRTRFVAWLKRIVDQGAPPPDPQVAGRLKSGVRPKEALMLYVWLLAVAACFTLLSVGYRQTNRNFMVVAGIFLFVTGLAPYVGELVRAMGIS